MNKNTFDINMGNFRPPNISRQTIVSAVVGLAALILIFSSVYQVQPEEVGVVLRFGRYDRTTEPGLRFKLPFMEEVRKVPVQRQLKQEFGFRTVEAAIRSRFSDNRFADESLMLTGDLNVAVVEWIIQYRVSDPYRYLFRVRNVEDTFRNMTEAVMRQVVGNRTVTEVLTVGRQDIEVTVQEKLQELCNQYETGITVDQVVLQDVNPPDPVKPSWDAVNQAQQQRDRLINEARAEYNQVIPRASGEAEQTVLQAEGYALERVNRSEGEATRFKALHDAYRRAPEVTRKRLYLETMQKVLPQVGGKILLDKDAQNLVPLLPMDALFGPKAAQEGNQ
ncbi:MAG TPA: FtsH protease activity modulator HflK [Acidobacteriota bacterium]|nr:FtsH protease activity modulator HflK [Acidobacteriota bacterium]